MSFSLTLPILINPIHQHYYFSIVDSTIIDTAPLPTAATALVLNASWLGFVVGIPCANVRCTRGLRIDARLDLGYPLFVIKDKTYLPSCCHCCWAFAAQPRDVPR